MTGLAFSSCYRCLPRLPDPLQLVGAAAAAAKAAHSVDGRQQIGIFCSKCTCQAFFMLLPAGAVVVLLLQLLMALVVFAAMSIQVKDVC